MFSICTINCFGGFYIFGFSRFPVVSVLQPLLRSLPVLLQGRVLKQACAEVMLTWGQSYFKKNKALKRRILLSVQDRRSVGKWEQS